MAFDAPLSPAAAQVVISAAELIAPPPEMRISDWVDLGQVILNAETNTSREGPISFDGVEYIREPLDRLHPDDPCERVTIKASAQTAKSTVGQLWVCWSIVNHQKSFAIGLPGSVELGKYNDFKLQPLIDASPEIKRRVRAVSTRSNEGSNAKKKRLYSGHSILLFNLSSPGALQMISTPNLILEEVGNALKDVGGRGSPVKQARARQAAHTVTGSKELMISTPAEVGDCEVTKAYEAGDQSRFYGQCVHCAGFFTAEPEGFTCTVGKLGPHLSCPGCGGLIEEHHRAHWRGDGYRWVPTFKAANPGDGPDPNPQPPAFLKDEAELARWRGRDREGRQPSYYAWQAFCGLISWAAVESEIRAAKTPAELKTLEQQVYGRAWDPAVDAMSWEEVHRLREEYETGVVPADAGVLTGFVDVQGGWLDGGVIGWGPGGEWWVVDRWIIEGDTSGADVWRELDAKVRTRYPHAAGGDLPIEAFGIDTGYRTQKAYGFAMGRPNVYAMDGRPGWKAPILAKPKIVKVIQDGRVRGRTKLYPSGTWELKSLLHWSLKLSVEAGYAVRVEGRGHWSRAEDEGWAQQITAEVLKEEKDPKSGETKRWWQVLSERRNEWTDIWVGARALAWSLGVGAPRRDGQPGEAIDWSARAAERAPSADQADLFTRASGLKPGARSNPTATPAPPKPKPSGFYRRRTP